jgi:hypothetical protein
MPPWMPSSRTPPMGSGIITVASTGNNAKGVRGLPGRLRPGSNGRPSRAMTNRTGPGSPRWDVEPEWRRLLKDAGFLIKQRLTWHKRSTGRGDIDGTFSPTCEDVLFASKGRHVLSHRPSMLLDVGCVPTWEKRHHPHQKPIALPRVLIEASTKHGDVVLDPFAGSGTTAVACMKAGRRCIAIELDTQYIPIIELRVRGAETPLFAALDEDR